MKTEYKEDKNIPARMIGTRKKLRKKVEHIDIEDRPENRWTLNPLSIFNNNFFRWFETRKKDIQGIEKYEDLSDCVNATTEAIAELLLEYEGGVFVKRLGYFCGMVIPWSKGFKIRTYGKTIKYDPFFHTDGYAYTLQFFPDTSRFSIFRGALMDRAFEPELKSKFGRRLYQGFRPKLYYTSVKDAYGYGRKRK